MSPQNNNEEIACLVEDTAGTGIQRTAHSSTQGSTSTSRSFRSCLLIALAFGATLFIVTLFTDTFEININRGSAAIEDKMQSTSSSPQVSDNKSVGIEAKSKPKPSTAHCIKGSAAFGT
jgi:hypothetical protein